MKAEDVQGDLTEVLYSKEDIDTRIAELAAAVDADYRGRDVLLVGVLKGAVMVMADLCRALQGQYPMDWMAVSSYGSGTKSSGVVRILKDLDTDLTGRDVLIVEDIIDSGLTLSWLRASPRPRRPPSTSSTWAGTSPTSSWWATGSTTPRSTATSTASRPWRRTSTSEPAPRAGVRRGGSRAGCPLTGNSRPVRGPTPSPGCTL